MNFFLFSNYNQFTHLSNIYKRISPFHIWLCKSWSPWRIMWQNIGLAWKYSLCGCWRSKSLIIPTEVPVLQNSLSQRKWWIVILLCRDACWWPHTLHLTRTLLSTVTLSKKIPYEMDSSSTLEHDFFTAILYYASIYEKYILYYLHKVFEYITLWFNYDYTRPPFEWIETTHVASHV